MYRRNLSRFLGFAALFATTAIVAAAEQSDVRYRTVEIDGLEIFYREAGPSDAPTVLLLHGFPTSSHMFRDLIPKLAEKYHVVAPDYPGFGYSSAPSVDDFDYTFDNLASIVRKFIDRVGLKSYSLYLMDYGAPVGFRIATAAPKRVESLIVQNGNAYEEGIANTFWDPVRKFWDDPSDENSEPLRGLLKFEGTKWQYTHGARDIESLNPDAWHHVQPLLDRPGNYDVQVALFYSYRTNPPLYPAWQAYMREHQPPTLVAWGKNDAIFPEAGAQPYKRDLKDLEFHLLDTGHFALEEEANTIAEHMLNFLDGRVLRNSD